MKPYKKKQDGLVEKEIIEKWNDSGYTIEKYGTSLKVILIGEEHYNKEFIRKQLELIRTLKPQYILHEFLAGEMYDPEKGMYEKQKGRRFNEQDAFTKSIEKMISEEPLPEGFIQVAREIGCKIIGCDLTQAELEDKERELAQKNPKKYSFEEIEYENETFRYLEKIDDPEWQNLIGEKESMSLRDTFMVKTIEEYNAVSSSLLVVIVGVHHSENIHKKRLLQKKRIGYIYINQANKHFED